MEQSDVFLSYRRKDVDFVKQIYEALKAAGREIWVDWEDIPPGVEGFGDEIQRGIEGANAFIAVLSPAYLESEYCLMELREALRLKKRIIPIVYQKFEPAPPPEGIGQINWVYFTPHAGQANTFEKFIPKVIHALEADYEYVREHTRLLVRALDWDKNQRNSSYLLKGAEIDKAESWQVQAAAKTPVPTELQGGYILVSRRQQRRQQQQFMAAIGGLLVLAIIAAVFAIFQANAAWISEEKAHSSALVSAALLPGNEAIAVALALEAVRGQNPSPEGFKVLALVAYPPGSLRYLHQPVPGEDLSQFFFPAPSPDGQLVVVKNHLYDLPTDKMVREFTETPGIILTSLFTPDGKNVILAGDDEGVNNPEANPVFMGLYEVATGKLILKFETGIGVSKIQLSADGKTLIGYQPDGKAVWWNLQTGQKIREFEAGETTTFSPDLKWLADLQPTTEPPGFSLTLQDLNTGDVRQLVSLPTDAWSGNIAFSPDQSEVAVALGTKLSSYQVATGELATRYADASADILGIRYSPDGLTLAAILADNSIIVWSRSTGALLIKQTAHKNHLLFADFVQNGGRIVSMDASGLVLEWDLLPGNVDRRLAGLETPRAITPDGRFLITVSYEQDSTLLHLRDAQTLEEKSQVVLPGVSRKGVGNSITSFYLAEGLEKGLFSYTTYRVAPDETRTSTISVASLTTGTVMQTLEKPGSAQILPNGREILVSSDDQKFSIWEIATGKLLREFAVPLNGFSVAYYNPIILSPTGAQALAPYTLNNPATENTMPPLASMFDLASGKILFTLEAQPGADGLMMQNGFFTRDGLQFISAANTTFGGGNAQLTVRDAKTGSPLREMIITTPPDAFFQFHPDGKSFFSGSSRGGGGGQDITPSGIAYGHGYSRNASIKHWDFASGELLWEFPNQDSLIIAPDGNRLFTDDGGLLAWRVDTPAQLVAWVCANRYVSVFTPEQRERFAIESATNLCQSQ